ncbi:MAG: RHS repeat-associated core domain-containing protein, partial [Simkaniaceae bacterium]|nr:RHS repeat-associated core domain-containing protein [Simkaniaceae bacterium]
LEVDRFGNESHYEFDALGRNILLTYPKVNTEVRYTYSYDLFDHLTSVTDPKGRTLKQAFTVHGNPTEIQHLDGNQEVFRYDTSGNLDELCDAEGVLQVFEYDYKGRLNRVEYHERGGRGLVYPFKKKTYCYNAFHKTSDKDERENKTTYTYGNTGNIKTLKKGDQNIEFIYDSLGRVHGVKKWKSSESFNLEIKEHDLLDRVIEERIENEHGKVLVKKRYVYNDSGQISQVIGYPQNRESILEKYEYDGFGRLSKVVNAAEQAVSIVYDDDFINEWGYKAQKRILIDSLGNQTEEIFDTDNHLIKVSKKDKSGKLLSESESRFDSFGNKIHEKTLVLSNRQSPRNYETEWSYNQKEQLEAYSLGKGATEESKAKFEYNTFGNLELKYDHGLAEPITYHYNKKGNLKKISYDEGDKNIQHWCFYDSHQNITKLTIDDVYTVSYTYNAQDLPLSETIKDQYGTYVVKRTYDGDGKIITLQLPDGSFVEYTYDGPFVKSASRFNNNKKELYHYQVISRDQMGNILEEVLPGFVGGRKQFWDAAGRKVELTTDFFQDKVLEGGYDPLGNIKKRQTTIDEETFTTEYDYNTLSQLITEKSEIENHYAYDSIGNRVQRNESTYKVNSINQLIGAEGATYTFNPNGNLATKTVNGKTWTYQSNALNQIVSIEDPNQTIVKFTYDLSGKRLTKRIEEKNKKPRIFRFFYLGNTEIGSLDEKGTIVELKIPSDPNHSESPSIAIELKRETYVPLYDLQGNIVCLLDHQRRKVVERYHYTAYGEEKIINARGKVISNSKVSNPWRYQAKRIDKATRLLYFGYRYYDPQIGRWITPDPKGAIDGPNLYEYTRSNPMTYVDYFGLSSTINETCRCMLHDHPGKANAPKDCVCICGQNEIFADHYPGQIGSSLQSVMSGIGHGVVDFVIGSLHGLQTAAVYIGSEEIEMTHFERMQMIEDVMQSQANQMSKLEDWMMDLMSIDRSNTLYQSSRSTTTLGLDVGSLVMGGYGFVKGAIGFSKLARMPLRASKIISKNLYRAESLYQGKLLGTHLKQVQKYGAQGYKKLANGKIRYYGDIDLAKTKGEMFGRRLVREWSPQTGIKRTWHDTIDQGGNIRIVRPETNDMNKIHYVFDVNGNFIGVRE